MENERVPDVTAIIVAAGEGRRMGGVSKPLLPLHGRKVIEWVLDAFEQCVLITQIVVVTRSKDLDDICALKKKYPKFSTAVLGGKTRQLSVTAGVQAAQGQCLAIHDGARPLITPDTIERVLKAAFSVGAAAAAVPVKDTIKIVDESGLVKQTPLRQTLWAVQTPQVFQKALFLKAMQAAVQDHRDYTDDCQLIEAIGEPVQLVEGAYANLKITTPEDLAQAESLLLERREKH